MPRVKKNVVKESLLRRVKRQRVKSITILPSLITILNGVCGFGAIILASKASVNNAAFAQAGYLVLLAMIADMLDGRVARMSHATSSFGGQLDSLCDIISFGVAPAFLTFKLLEYKLGLTHLNHMIDNSLQRFILVAGAAYLCCTAIRLARFNVENEEDETAHMSFVGLPSPAAAGVIISIIIFQQETLADLAVKNSQIYGIFEKALLFSLPLIMFGTGILMVSRIRYPHVLNQYFKGKKPFAYLLWLLVILVLIFCWRQPALVLSFCGFAASGFVKWLYHKIIKRSRPTSTRAVSPKALSDEIKPASQDITSGT
ncbi:MAG: CDP-diacylglycerol--serine O-phosphatidyltransferase [Planctomycetota bacterium]|jgi:CDP-diacylglycerol--serine O-phosphatidyltransferase